MTNAQIKAWARKAKTPVGYNAEAKEAFLRGARSFANELAKRLGLESGSFDIRRNDGGIAVSGEVKLHAEHLYVSIEQSGVGSGGFYYRTCKHRKDYTGGVNNWVMWDRLIADPDYVIAGIKLLSDRELAARA